MYSSISWLSKPLILWVLLVVCDWALMSFDGGADEGEGVGECVFLYAGGGA